MKSEQIRGKSPVRRTFSDVDFAAFVYQHTYSTSNFQIPFVKSGKTRRFTKLDCGMSNEAMLGFMETQIVDSFTFPYLE